MCSVSKAIPAPVQKLQQVECVYALAHVYVTA